MHINYLTITFFIIVIVLLASVSECTPALPAVSSFHMMLVNLHVADSIVLAVDANVICFHSQFLCCRK